MDYAQEEEGEEDDDEEEEEAVGQLDEYNVSGHLVLHVDLCIWEPQPA